MKEMTGGDKIVARSLNKDPIEFKPQFNMILTCNQRPKIPSDDQGSWRRIRVVEFTSKFTANPDPNDPNQFMIDTDLTSKLKKWGKPFFWILTQYYKEFKKNGYKEPAEVTAATNEYQKEQDAYSEFVTDCLKLDKTSYADVKEVYTVFQEYVRYNNDQKPSKKAFEKYMNTRFGKFGRHRDSKCWKGFKIDEAALNENYGISENPEDELL
jgi:P4 family phage/plasmid primase-like protien